MDSAYYYMDKIKPLMKDISPEEAFYVWTDLGRTFEEIDPQKSISLYNKALLLGNDPKIYGFMANAYYKNGDGEKALELWRKSLSTPDISFQIDILQRQHQYLSEQDREHEAHEVAKRIIALKDSLTLTQQQDSVREIQEMLDREYMEQEAHEEKHFLLVICALLTLLMVIGIAIYFIRRQHYHQQIKLHKDEAQANKKEIEQLQGSSEQSAKDIKQLHKEVEMLRNEQSQLLAKGKQLYDDSRKAATL